jgi:hypothetical protein
MVVALANDARDAAIAAVGALGPNTTANDYAIAEARLRAAADTLKRAQTFLAQWP